jgi:hypothetical protein
MAAVSSAPDIAALIKLAMVLVTLTIAAPMLAGHLFCSCRTNAEMLELLWSEAK